MNRAGAVALAALVLASCSSQGVSTSAPSSAPSGVVDAGPVPDDHGIAEDVISGVRDSTVAIRGLGCPRVLVGSGFVIEPALVLTSAHVVAGVAAPTLRLSGVDDGLTGRVVAIDPVRDLALVAATGLEAPPLPLGDAIDDLLVALVGYDGDGAESERPGRIDRHIRATGNDIHGSPADGRDALVVAADVDPGHSGAPLVDADGLVVGVVFSSVTGGRPTAFAVQTSEVETFLEERPDDPSGPGDCR